MGRHDRHVHGIGARCHDGQQFSKCYLKQSTISGVAFDKFRNQS